MTRANSTLVNRAIDVHVLHDAACGGGLPHASNDGDHVVFRCRVCGERITLAFSLDECFEVQAAIADGRFAAAEVAARRKVVQ